jgi:hypothetical protein
MAAIVSYPYVNKLVQSVCCCHLVSCTVTSTLCLCLLLPVTDPRCDPQGRTVLILFSPLDFDYLRQG